MTPTQPGQPDLAELRRLAEAATPGPWRASGATMWRSLGDRTPTDFSGVAVAWVRDEDVPGLLANAAADAAYIVALVNAAPALLSRIEALETALRPEAVHRAIQVTDQRGCGGTHLMGYGFCQALSAALLGAPR